MNLDKIFYAGGSLVWNLVVRRGKSGLQRARCQVTPGKRKLTESATENRPPVLLYR